MYEIVTILLACCVPTDVDILYQRRNNTRCRYLIIMLFISLNTKTIYGYYDVVNGVTT